MNPNQLVSVVVTTYNQEAYIGATLESVLNQTYRPMEVIVVDDGSSDGTPGVIAAFGKEIIAIRQDNQGVAGSRNTGIRRATGAYIAFMDGDDLWEPDKLMVQVDAARNHPESGLIVVDGVQFEGDRVTTGTLLFAPWCSELEEGKTVTTNLYRRLLKEPFISTTSQVMVPREVFGRVGLSDPRFRGASDYDLYIRIARHYPVTIVKQPLTRWRYLRGSVSGPGTLRGYRYLPEDIAILNRNLRRAEQHVRPFIRGIIGDKLRSSLPGIYYYGLEEDRRFSSRILWQLVRENPFPPMPFCYLAGLWCPEFLRRWCGPAVRRLFSRSAA